MKIRRHSVLSATVVAVAIAAFAVPAPGVQASVPPTPPPSSVPTDGSTPTPAGDGVIEESFALAPAGSLDAGQAGNRPEFSYAADAGSVIDDGVTLYNYGDRQLNFKLYATDAFNDEQGNFLLPPGDTPPVNVGGWVTIDQSVVTVPAGMQVTVPIHITIPDDAAPGDHVGAILASSPTMGTGANGELITVDRRTGPRLYVRVNGALNPELAITNVNSSYDESANPLNGDANVTFHVENRGNIRLGGVATVTVGGPFGLGDTSVKLPDLPELLPGQHIVVTAHLSGVLAGIAAFTEVKLQPTSGGEGVGEVTLAKGTDWTLALPITPLLVLLLLAILWGLRRRYRKHSRATTPFTASVSYDDEREPVHS